MVIDNDFKVIELFAGAGGLALGMERSGFQCLMLNEIDKNAAETFRKNFNHKLVVDDIYNIKSEDLPDADVIVGGFPCQAFSVAGYRKGFEDERGKVFFQMAEL